MSAGHDCTVALLIGHGSIGRAHRRVLATMFDRVVVVDALAAAREEVVESGGEAAPALDDLDAQRFPYAEALAVIATWGPSHRELFDALVDRGVRHILCEKPIAASLADAGHMVDRARDSGVALGVNFVRRYGGEAAAIAGLAATHGLGDPVSVVVHGGTRGLVTNGVHLVELCCDLLGSEPRSVCSTATPRRINPRSPDIDFYGGTSVWSFADDREVVMSFPFGSTLKESVSVYFRDAEIVLRQGSQVTVRRRDPAEVAEHPAITWTGQASEVLYEGPLPGVLTGDDRIEAALEAVRSGDERALRPEDHVRSLEAIIASLVAGAERRTVDLPLAPASPVRARSWAIS